MIQDDTQKALLSVPPRSVRGILYELSDLRKRANAGEYVIVPLVTFHLKSGRDITGWITSVGEERQEQVVLVQLMGEDRRPSYDLVYINVSNIEAITVLGAGRIAHLLSSGKVSEQPGTPPPTKLELKRKTETCSKTVSELFCVKIYYEIDWEKMPHESLSFHSLSNAISEVTGILSDMGKDEQIRNIIGKIIKKIMFIHEEVPSVVRDGDCLQVRLNMPKGRDGRFSRQLLREEIEKVF